jgi:hypothetical protein
LSFSGVAIGHQSQPINRGRIQLFAAAGRPAPGTVISSKTFHPSSAELLYTSFAPVNAYKAFQSPSFLDLKLPAASFASSYFERDALCCLHSETPTPPFERHDLFYYNNNKDGVFHIGSLE